MPPREEGVVSALLVPAVEVPVEAGSAARFRAAPALPNNQRGYLEVEGKLRQVGERLPDQIDLDPRLLSRINRGLQPSQLIVEPWVAVPRDVTAVVVVRLSGDVRAAQASNGVVGDGLVHRLTAGEV